MTGVTKIDRLLDREAALYRRCRAAMRRAEEALRRRDLPAYYRFRSLALALNRRRVRLATSQPRG